MSDIEMELNEIKEEIRSRSDEERTKDIMIGFLTGVSVTALGIIAVVLKHEPIAPRGRI